MEFFELLNKRYSVRAYQSTPVETQKLHQVLEAARLAPTAANRQPFQIIAAHVAGKEEALQRVYHREWFIQAPLVLCVCALKSQAWVRSHDALNAAAMDSAIVMTHIILAAADLGLGTCWVGAFDPQAAREVFQLPPGVEPAALTPLGYPADTLPPKTRRPLQELVRYEHW
ncbi:MAG: nitroreductase family protein [Chloroflexota bacterium]